MRIVPALIALTLVVPVATSAVSFSSLQVETCQGPVPGFDVYAGSSQSTEYYSVVVVTLSDGTGKYAYAVYVGSSSGDPCPALVEGLDTNDDGTLDVTWFSNSSGTWTPSVTLPAQDSTTTFPCAVVEYADTDLNGSYETELKLEFKLDANGDPEMVVTYQNAPTGAFLELRPLGVQGSWSSGTATISSVGGLYRIALANTSGTIEVVFGSGGSIQIVQGTTVSGPQAFPPYLPAADVLLRIPIPSGVDVTGIEMTVSVSVDENLNGTATALTSTPVTVTLNAPINPSSLPYTTGTTQSPVHVDVNYLGVSNGYAEVEIRACADYEDGSGSYPNTYYFEAGSEFTIQVSNVYLLTSSGKVEPPYVQTVAVAADPNVVKRLARADSGGKRVDQSPSSASARRPRTRRSSVSTLSLISLLLLSRYLRRSSSRRARISRAR